MSAVSDLPYLVVALTLLASAASAASAANCTAGECLNGGICNNYTASPPCICPLPYIGSYCAAAANYCSTLQPEKNITSFPVCLNNCSCTMGFSDPYFSCTDTNPVVHSVGVRTCRSIWSGLRCGGILTTFSDGSSTVNVTDMSSCRNRLLENIHSAGQDWRLLSLLLLLLLPILIGVLIYYLHKKPRCRCNCKCQNPTCDCFKKQCKLETRCQPNHCICQQKARDRKPCHHGCGCQTAICPCYKYECKQNASFNCQKNLCRCQKDKSDGVATNGHSGPLLVSNTPCGCDCKSSDCPCFDGAHTDIKKCLCHQNISENTVQQVDLSVNDVYAVIKKDKKTACGCRCQSLECPCVNCSDQHGAQCPCKMKI